MKALHKLLVTSATYRQASRVEEREVGARPVQSVARARPRFRMEAEMIGTIRSPSAAC
jgi:hypothetical protein